MKPSSTRLKTIVLIALTIISITGIGQDKNISDANTILNIRGEVYFQFQLNPGNSQRQQLDLLTRIISIDKVEGEKVIAYANKHEFNEFLKLKYKFRLLTPPSMIRQPRMLDANEIRSRTVWDFYPTYGGYVDIMDQFETDYPDLCEVVNIGTLDSGRELLFIHINDSLGVDQNEPEFMYTSSMHGDELTGYVLSLHLIEYLLENYGSDDQVTNLVNNIDIWINPLANPDGTYAGGDNTVYGATRYNGNGIDLNRNYPDPEDGQHPDGEQWQSETEAFMAFADDHDFVMSANFHGGSEVCNYPWDTWSRLHADDAWWKYVCRQWADTVHKYGPSGYFTDLMNGITNGNAWYRITGGRQDYMNYFQHCREFTCELSHTKTPPASQLPGFWDYQYHSWLNYMEQALYGVRGLVTNSVNGNAVPAKVFVENHDKDESQVYASLPIGNYYRPIKQGTYDFTFSSSGYYSKTIENVLPKDLDSIILNVALQPFMSPDANFLASDTIIENGGTVDFTDVSVGDSIISWDWTFEGGDPGSSTNQNPSGIMYTENGSYNVSLTVKDSNGGTNTITKENYILVTNSYPMKDTTIYLCDGLFYDSGGATSNYSDGEDFTITFISLLESGTLKAVFFDFALEENDNCNYDFIEAYNGIDTNAPMIGKWCGSDLPDSITANNVSGALTFRFHSNESNNYSGWKAFLTCDTSVGIPEKKYGLVELFPNPATEMLTIQSPELIQTVRIYDIQGHEVYNSHVSANSINLDVRDYRKGFYIAVIKTGNRILTKKMVLQ